MTPLPRVLLAITLVTFAAAPALAQSNAVMAESLFQEGKRLLRDKKYDQACPKFVESARLDPSSGVELALGLCYEGQGKTASAWGAYVLAASLARRDNRADREKAATEHVAAIEPRLSHVTIEIAPATASIAGLEVRENGIVLGQEAWKDSPLDPGEHALVVTAPGRRPYHATFTVEAGSDRMLVPVPPLSRDETIAPLVPRTAGEGEPKPEPPAAPEKSAMAPAGYVLLAVGLAAVAVGSGLGVAAIDKAHAANRVCSSPPTCGNAAAVASNNTAGTFADWSTGTLIGGGVGALVGILLVALAPSREAADKGPAKAASRLWLGVDGRDVAVGYRW